MGKNLRETINKLVYCRMKISLKIESIMHEKKKIYIKISYFTNFQFFYFYFFGIQTKNSCGDNSCGATRIKRSISVSDERVKIDDEVDSLKL